MRDVESSGEVNVDYRQAGVDIDAAEEAKSRIKDLARTTFNPAVLSSIGSFGSLFSFDTKAYDEPLLVASTDGVGTKIQVARLANRHDTVGYDLVAHCVNDILVQGAAPLFFLDYVALGAMDPDLVESIVSGFVRACKEFSCPLVGGRPPRCPARTLRETTTSPGSSSASSSAARPSPVPRFERGTSCGAPLRRPAHERLLAGAQGLVRALRYADRHSPGRHRGQRGWRPASAPRLLSLRSQAAHREGPDRGPVSHHGRRIPGQRPASPSRGPAAFRSTAVPGPSFPSSKRSRRAEASRKRKCSARSTWVWE